ncbi:hypothetical protein Caci_5698 [Catenulispora acidiphila DSM 44928]|uniref:Secreted protein n=1 Tax=Catenulispora acidiphila (strain DSM 44928 / JCM 14897 / NBRC 102108 / NRRL B-24433 / ID139908) TaxID=479433 RepID=C7QCA8_CATAD|nr:hypothetical protein [Catenulispora acidiphila]ACU74556.1 hypothetical protein Caci_5698 [Catenulispora acidiphila DSM 44928]
MRAKRLRRTGIPALVSLTIAGTMALSTGTAFAGAWIDTQNYFPSKAACNSWASQQASDYGWTTWDCRFIASKADGYPWDLFAFEA